MQTSGEGLRRGGKRATVGKYQVFNTNATPTPIKLQMNPREDAAAAIFHGAGREKRVSTGAKNKKEKD